MYYNFSILCRKFKKITQLDCAKTESSIWPQNMNVVFKIVQYKGI